MGLNMSESELKDILVDELQNFVDEKLSDIDYWVEKIDEGELSRDDVDHLIDNVLPYTRVQLITE